MLTSRLIIGFSLTMVSIGLQGCESYQKTEAKNASHEAAAKRFGLAYNEKRKALDLPLLPDNWGLHGVTSGDRDGLSTFSKPTSSQDSLPHRARKDVYFYSATLQPMREVDTYYFGKKYFSYSKESDDWERVLIVYDYVTDSLKNRTDEEVIGYKSKLVAGRIQAFFCSPKPTVGESNLEPVDQVRLILKSQSISLAQADSVLTAWGLSRKHD